jgi:TonB family protein
MKRSLILALGLAPLACAGADPVPATPAKPVAPVSEAPPEEGTTGGRKLPSEAIPRIIRQSFGRFRLCYKDGLRNNPELQGTVTVRFVIDESGAVASVANAGSNLPDASVISCVTRAISSLSFPKPVNGTVTVTYPVQFNPDDEP